MPISFKQIPSRLRVPGVFIEQTSKLISSGERLNTVLHLGYAAGGNADPNRIYKITSLDEAKKLFGEYSMLAQMVERHLKINKGLLLYAAAVKEPTAQVAAEGFILVEENALEDDLLSIRIADHKLPVSIKAGETDAVIAKRIADTINADPACLVTAQADAKLVTLTAKIAGEMGNEIPVLVDYLPEEVPQLPVAVGKMEKGEGVPDLKPVLEELGDDAYDYIVSAFSDADARKTLDEFAAARWHAMAGNIESIVVYAFKGTQPEAVEKGKLANSEFMSCICTGNTAPQPSWVWSAALVAQTSDRLTNDPSAPITNIKITTLKAPKDCWNWQQRNELLFSGVSTFTQDKAGNVYLEKMITTYQTNAKGFPDASYLSIHVPELMRNIRRIQCAQLASIYDGYKLTDFPEQHAAGQKITSTAGIRATLIGIYQSELMDKRAWVTDFEHYKDSILVERDPDNRSRVNFIDEPVMIGQLDIIAGQSELQHG